MLLFAGSAVLKEMKQEENSEETIKKNKINRYRAKC